MITPEIKSIIQSFGVGAVATVSPDGKPMVSPKGTFLVLDESEIAFAHIRSPQTVRNIQSNPAMEVSFVDIFQRVGCRVSGQASYVPRSADEAAHYCEAFGSVWPTLLASMKGYIALHVENAELLQSPVYDLGSKSADLDHDWMQKYVTLIEERSGKR